jgi:glycosyltransferase involved in cell wall biosynthesis
MRVDSSPLCSIIIPAFNAAPYVEQAVESVLAQSYPNYELVIVDDASTDNTPEILEGYRTHPKVRLYRNRTNLGMAANWNAGLGHAQGALIAKLDADDLHAPDFLAEVVPVFQKYPAVGLVFSAANLLHRNGRVTPEKRFFRSRVYSGGKFLENLLRACVIRSPTVCARRTCYDQLGYFWPTLSIHADWEMWVRIAFHYDVGYVAKYLASYRLPYGNNCTSQVCRDDRSIQDFRMWLSFLDQGLLPCRLNPSQEIMLRNGIYELEMAFAALCFKEGAKEMLEKYCVFAEEVISVPTSLPRDERLKLRRAKLYLERGRLAHLQRRAKEAREYLLKAVAGEAKYRKQPMVWALLATSFLGDPALEMVYRLVRR